MILRRLSDHVKHQNWFAVALDFVIVVTGVFIGLQASNWNDNRETRQRAAVFNERLIEDLRYEAWAYQFLVDYNKDVRAAAKAALGALYGSEPLSDEEFLINTYRATQYKYMDRYRATFDELISMGDIGLIYDDNLRTTAVSIYTTALLDVIADEGREAPIRNIFRRRVPADIQEALLKKCGGTAVQAGDYEGIVGSLAYRCKLDLDPQAIGAAASLLRADDTLVEALQSRFADLETAITDLENENAEVLLNLRTIAGRNP